MTQYLVIRIIDRAAAPAVSGASDATASLMLQWGCYSAEQAVLFQGEGSQDELESVLTAELSAEQRAKMGTVAIAPAERILLTTASVPAKNLSQKIQALPYVVEEQLIGDVETMHFALGASKGPLTEVAVVGHQCMQSWGDVLAALPVRVDTVIPEQLCVPVDGDKAAALLDGDRILLRTGTSSGLVTEPQALPTLLQLSAAKGQGESTIADLTVIQCSSDRIDTVSITTLESELAQLEIDAQFESQTTTVFELLAKQAINQLSSASTINLLQGRYQATPETSGRQQWLQLAKVAAVLIVLWGSLNIAVGGYYTWRAEGLTQEAVELYRAIFPNARNVNAFNVEKRMQVHLQDGNGGQGVSSFVQLLEHSTQPLAANAAAYQIRQLRFDGQNDGLTLELTTQNVQLLDQYKQQLTEHGLKVKILSANEDNNAVLGRLLVRR